MLSDTAVKAIQDSQKTELITVDDGSYLTRPVYLPPGEPAPAAIIVHSLAGFCDYVQNVNKKEGEPSIIAVQVCSPGLVRAFSAPIGRKQERAVAIEAQRFDTKGFKFNQPLQTEDFIIGLQAHFVPNADTQYLAGVVGNITDSASLEVGDNGVTQTVKLRKGLTLTDKTPTELKSVVMLRPFRTFAELDQPESPFVFRMQRRDGALPMAALYEADDLRWKLLAMDAIKAYLSERIKALPVLA